jgi:hypothetical protein
MNGFGFSAWAEGCSVTFFTSSGFCSGEAVKTSRKQTLATTEQTMSANTTNAQPFLEALESRVFLSGDLYAVNTPAQAHPIAIDVAKSTYPLAGTRTIKLYGDDSIANGVQIDSHATTVTTSTTDGVNYKLALSGRTLLSMVRSDNLLSLKPQPQPYGVGRADNAYMVSAGSCGAVVLMGQTDTNPDRSLNVSIRLGTWAGNQEVSDSRLAGKWKMRIIENDNLRDKPALPFSARSVTFTITDLGNGKVRLRAAKTKSSPAVNWVMRIKGSTLKLMNPPAAWRYTSMVTDGQHIVWANVGVELNDATDVSATIATAVRT